jgi:transcriptional repressor NrdR
MRCPYCGNPDTQVKDSRPSEDNTSIRRRRVCPDCGGRFTTFERVQLRELMVMKKSGKRVPFDRDKLMRSVQVALRKRSVDPERVERMVNGIVRQLESMGEPDVSSEQIGHLVMEGLKGLDAVAYVRFASVYKNFREAKDFEAFVGELAEDVTGGEHQPWRWRPGSRKSTPSWTAVSWRPRFASAGAISAIPFRTPPSAPSSWPMAASSVAAGRRMAAVPMPRSWRSPRPARPPAAPRST